MKTGGALSRLKIHLPRELWLVIEKRVLYLKGASFRGVRLQQCEALVENEVRTQ